jgi:hypothetical protein
MNGAPPIIPSWAKRTPIASAINSGTGDFFSDIWHSITSSTGAFIAFTVDTIKLNPGKAIHDIKATLYDSIKPIAPILPIVSTVAAFIPGVGTVVSLIVSAVNIAYEMIAKGYAKAALGTIEANQVIQARAQVMAAIKTLNTAPQADAATAYVISNLKLVNGAVWNDALALYCLSVAVAATMEAVGAGLAGDAAAAQAAAVSVQTLMATGWPNWSVAKTPNAKLTVEAAIPAVLSQFNQTCDPINSSLYATAASKSSGPAALPIPAAPASTTNTIVDSTGATVPVSPAGVPTSFTVAPSYMTPTESYQSGMMPAAMPASTSVSGTLLPIAAIGAALLLFL